MTRRKRRAPPCPDDAFRLLVVTDYEASGKPAVEIAARWGVSTASVWRWWSQSGDLTQSKETTR